MNPSVYVCIILLLLVVYLQRQRRKKVAVMRHMKRNRKGQITMLEMLERFIGKECIVYALENQITGTIREIRDGWIIVENDKGTEALNAEFVTRVREYPRKKNGKKAAIID